MRPLFYTRVSLTIPSLHLEFYLSIGPPPQTVGNAASETRSFRSVYRVCQALRVRSFLRVFLVTSVRGCAFLSSCFRFPSFDAMQVQLYIFAIPSQK